MRILFLSWFLGSMILFFIFAIFKLTNISLITFGQTFLILGILVIKEDINKEKRLSNFMILLFPIVGAGIIAFSIASYFNFSFVKKYWPLAIAILFIIIGLILIIQTSLNRARKRKYCTYPIKAVIVDIKKKNNNGAIVYCPVYQIYYNKEDIELCDNEYTNVYHQEIGENLELFINPDEPEEFIDSSRAKTLSILDAFLGLGCIILGLLAVYFSLINF